MSEFQQQTFGKLKKPMWKNRYKYDTDVKGITDVPKAIFGGLGNAIFGDKEGYQYTPTEEYQNQIFTDTVQDRVGGNIGSRPDSVRVGPPSPMGNIPFVSFGGKGAKETTSNVGGKPLTQVQRTKPPVTPPQVNTQQTQVRGPQGPTRATGVGTPTTAQTVALPPKLVGFGAYFDGTPITDTLSDQEKALLPGNNPGAFEGGGIPFKNTQQSRIGLYYSPEEQAQVAAMHKVQDSAPVNTTTRSMSPGSQGAWEQEQAHQSAMNNVLGRLPTVSQGLPRNVFKAAELAQGDTRIGNEYELGRGNLDVNRLNASTNRETGLGNLGVNQGTLDLHRQKLPYDINKLQSDIKLQGIQGEELSARLAQYPDETLAKLYTAMGLGHASTNGSNAAGIDYTKGAESILKIDEAIRLEQDPNEKNRLIALRGTIENTMRQNPVKGSVSTKPALQSLPRG